MAVVMSSFNHTSILNHLACVCQASIQSYDLFASCFNCNYYYTQGMKQKKSLAVCGYKAVKTLANTNPEKILRFYYAKERSSEFGMLCKKLAENKIPYNQVENNELEKLSKSLHHQGLVAFIAEPEIEQLSKEKVLEFMRNKEKLVFLDLVGNSNNLGAIIRSAAFFGIRHIIIPEDEKQASIATSTYRVAQGGMEFVSLYFVKSPEFFLQDIAGKIIRIGTDLEAKKNISDISHIYTPQGEKKASLIILGNEEEGISPQIKNLCDELVKIPGGKNMQSLNVAQAASIIFYELTRT